MWRHYEWPEQILFSKWTSQQIFIRCKTESSYKKKFLLHVFIAKLVLYKMLLTRLKLCVHSNPWCTYYTLFCACLKVSHIQKVLHWSMQKAMCVVLCFHTSISFQHSRLFFFLFYSCFTTYKTTKTNKKKLGKKCSVCNRL
jgi:hypothetical protein